MSADELNATYVMVYYFAGDHVASIRAKIISDHHGAIIVQDTLNGEQSWFPHTAIQRIVKIA